MANQLGLLSYNNQTMTTHCSSKPTPGGFWTCRMLAVEENLHIIAHLHLDFCFFFCSWFIISTILVLFTAAWICNSTTFSVLPTGCLMERFEFQHYFGVQNDVLTLSCFLADGIFPLLPIILTPTLSLVSWFNWCGQTLLLSVCVSLYLSDISCLEVVNWTPKGM